MNFKLVLKTYSQLRQLSDDEAALLATLRAMSDSERELLVESLGPPVKVKGKVATKRNIEKCAVDDCGLTRRARVHRDGLHEFLPLSSSSKSKSAHASSLAEKVKGAIEKVAPNRCITNLPNGSGVCGLGPEDVLHHDQSYGNYHPFVSSSPARNAAGQSSTKDDEANSGTDSDAVSSAVGG